MYIKKYCDIYEVFVDSRSEDEIETLSYPNFTNILVIKLPCTLWLLYSHFLLNVLSSFQIPFIVVKIFYIHI